MANRRKRKLSVRITYEPNRLAKTHLLTAYEKLVPMVKCSLNQMEKKGLAIDDIFLKKLGGE